MHPCLWCIRPPRAADGPITARTWRRLAFVLSALLALLALATLQSRMRARGLTGLEPEDRPPAVAAAVAVAPGGVLPESPPA